MNNEILLEKSAFLWKSFLYINIWIIEIKYNYKQLIDINNFFK